MAEISAAPWNGYRVVSTFSGAGGSCLGFRMAGFRVVWASEFIEAARETYRANFPDTPIDDRDIRDVHGDEIRAAAGLGADDEIDVVEGSPPCASFSTAGRRSKFWGQKKRYSDAAVQRTDDLFLEFARLVGELRPRCFVAENVSGLIRGVARGYFVEIVRALEARGYRVEARTLDAQWLGVPQMRRRVIFVGVRQDVAAEPVFPRPLPYRYSVRDAIGDLIDGEISSTGIGRGLHRSPDVPASTILTHGNLYTRSERSIEIATRYRPGGAPAYERKFSGENQSPTVLASGLGTGFSSQVRIFGRTGPQFRRVESEIDEPTNTILASDVNHARYLITGTAIGREWERLRPGQASERYFNLVRSHPDRPVQTVTQLGGANRGVASVTHPSEPRKFTIAELRRLCSFPDDFVLTGTYAQQWERCGRAVPPLMMFAVARSVLEMLRAAERAAS